MTIKNLEDAYMAQIEKLKAELEAERAKALDLEFARERQAKRS